VGPVLAVIPARAGSKGFPNKNRQRIRGLSLVQLAIRAAQMSRTCDLIAVTTADALLAAQARSAGVIVIRRPARLATDRSPTMAAVTHAVTEVERAFGSTVDTVVVLEPTTPLRSARDIREAVLLNRKPGRPNIATVTPMVGAGWLCRIGRGGRLKPIDRRRFRARRQQGGEAYLPNGAVYVLTRRRLARPWHERALGCVMPKERSIDIDDRTDLRIARALASIRSLM